LRKIFFTRSKETEIRRVISMCKVLIVEDNATFRQMLKEILYSRFPTMDIAEEPDGSGLFSKIETFHPKIIFMDIRLPGESGLELTKKIKMNYPDITVIVLTSYDLPEYRQAARQNKADHFVTKDSPTQDFLTLIESILHAKNLEPNKQMGLS
jgi:DNA-binding NarL/FixJ family response regulator